MNTNKIANHSLNFAIRSAVNLWAIAPLAMTWLTSIAKAVARFFSSLPSKLFASPNRFQRPRKRKSFRTSLSHGLALVLGVILGLDGLPMLPLQASPVDAMEPVEVAQAVPAQRASVAALSSNSFVTSAVNQVGPAVVRIDTERTVTQRINPAFDDPFFERFFGDEFFRSAPRERQRRLTGQGSGFIIDSDGSLLTNAHVVDKADRVVVTLKDGREFEGTVKGADPVTDLALVKIDAKGDRLPVASLGDSDNVQVGDWAIAVGNPLGLDNTVTLGIISTLKRSSAQVGIPDKRLDFIQTDAAINPGNSGGPLVDANGRVIGINTAIRADAMGIGFAIPINKAKSIQAQLAKGQRVPHPFVGIEMRTLTPELARKNNEDPNALLELPVTTGVLVVNVLPDMPAAEAGLRRGDVIVSAGGKRIESAEAFQRAVENTAIGKTLKLQVKRGNRDLTINVRTAELQDLS
ncbi:MAG: HhoA/HhoB/HtrA family serine endopeptidase [Cyanophyceae cyanobacterium]